MNIKNLRKDVIGIDAEVTLLDGSRRKYVFLDNAASTPAFRSVLRSVEDLLQWYSGVHRGTGYKSQISTVLYDRAHAVVAKFVNADMDSNVVIFVKNSTEAINKLANRLDLTREDIVITTLMEHHSNDLPWRKYCRVIHIDVDNNGFLRLEDLKQVLKTQKGKVKLVAVSGASNITGICNPVHDIAKWTHDAGAKIFVDAAQLAPHRPINILSNDDPSHIDFLAFSAHKMYAPFGTGVLIGPREIFEKGTPDVVGGGVVSAVSLDDVHWSSPPDKDEAGSPNVVGAVALAKSISLLDEAGMDKIAQHETKLLEYIYERMKNIPGVIHYGPTTDLERKVGVISFNIKGMHNALVASIMSAEGGIGLRNGCFCAHPYVKRLLNISKEQDKIQTERMVTGDRSDIPGLVRASFGCYNNEDDIDIFIEVLERIAHRKYKGTYIQNPRTGSFMEKNHILQIPSCFNFLKLKYERDDSNLSEAS